jgi:mediator of RNA polymerase II transcription subunit 16
MEHPFGTEDGQYDASKLTLFEQKQCRYLKLTYLKDKTSATIASLVLAFARACGHDNSTDDIVAVALRQMTPGTRKPPQNGMPAILTAPDLQNLFIHDVYRALPMNVDFTVEQEKLMTNPYIVKSLGMQAALGFKSCYVRRDLTAVVPWIILNLRHISVLITFFFQYTNKGAKEADLHEPGEYI